MEQNIDKRTVFSSLTESAARSGALKCVTFSSPADKSSETVRVRGEIRNIGGKTVLQLEYALTEGRLRHENIPVDSGDVYSRAAELTETQFRRAELYAAGECATLMISKKGKTTLLLPSGFEKKIASSEGTPAENRGNDRQKNYMIPEDAPFLYTLGVSDANGRVKDKKRAKFRQINRFCEYARDELSRVKIGSEECVRIADMCCGKSYLSFALYYTVTEVMGNPCEMVCVDLKKSVIEEVSTIAKECGFDGMTFLCGDVSKYEAPWQPHMVVSLHACDVATDMVLDFAVKSGAMSILSTPCCHHELSEKLDCPALGFIASHSVLKQKLCAAATDSLRLLRLEAAGYKVDAVEFVDPEDTPKNVMLRGRKTGKKNPSAEKEYRDAYRFLMGKDAPLITE